MRVKQAERIKQTGSFCGPPAQRAPHEGGLGLVIVEPHQHPVRNRTAKILSPNCIGSEGPCLLLAHLVAKLADSRIDSAVAIRVEQPARLVIVLRLGRVVVAHGGVERDAKQRFGLDARL